MMPPDSDCTVAMAATPSVRQARKMRKPFRPPRNSRRAMVQAIESVLFMGMSQTPEA